MVLHHQRLPTRAAVLLLGTLAASVMPEIAQGAGCSAALDIAIGMDQSGSVNETPGAWEKEKTFVSNLVDALAGGGNRYYVIKWDDYWQEVVDGIGSRTTDKEVKDLVKQAVLTGWGTTMTPPLMTMTAKLNSPASARNVRVLMLITDGQAQDKPAALEAAKAAKKAGITVVTIGVLTKYGLDEDMLTEMSSTLSGKRLYFGATDWDDLGKQLKTIASTLCQISSPKPHRSPPPKPTPAPAPKPTPAPSPKPQVTSKGFPYCSCPNYGANPFQLTKRTVTNTARGRRYCWDLVAEPELGAKCGSFDLRKIEVDIDPSCNGAAAEITFDGQPLTPNYQRFGKKADGKPAQAVLKIGHANSAQNILGKIGDLAAKPVKLCITLRAGRCGTLSAFCPGGVCRNAFFSPPGSCCSRGAAL